MTQNTGDLTLDYIVDKYYNRFKAILLKFLWTPMIFGIL